MKTRMTIEQLEQMKSHELADWLANNVILLRGMPNVECSQLMQQIPDPQLPQPSLPISPFTLEELKNKKVEELKKIAKELHLTTSGRKEDLVKKILARSASGRSEQYAIQEV